MCVIMLRIVKILSFLCVAYLYCTYIFVLTPNSQKPCIILYKNKVIFFGKLLLFDMPTCVCTDTIYQIETSKEIRLRKRADIVNLDKLPLNLVDISVSQWSTDIRRFWCRAPNTATSPCYHMLHVAVTTMFRFSNRFLRVLRTLRPNPVDIQKTTWFCFLSRAVWTIPTRFRLWQWCRGSSGLK